GDGGSINVAGFDANLTVTSVNPGETGQWLMGGNLGTEQVNFGAVDFGSHPSVIFAGNQVIGSVCCGGASGETNIFATGPKKSVIVNDGVLIVGLGPVNLNTNHYVLIGSGLIIGNPLNFNFTGAGTI